MRNSKIFILIVLFVTIATNASATPKNSGNNSQELDRTNTQQLKVAQQFLSDREWRNDRGRINKMLEQLNLSARQSRQVAAIRQRFQTERDTLFQQVKNHRQEMRSLLATDTSSDRLKQDYRETQSLLERLNNNRFEMMMQVRKILTPEQRARFLGLIGDW